MKLETQKEVELSLKDAIESQAKKLALDFSGSYEGIIPDSIGDISSLDELTIYNSSLRPHPLKEIPVSIGKLSNLKTLRLYDFGFGLEYLPESIGELVNLEVLQIADCPKLRELPNTIGQLKNLREIKLYSPMRCLKSFEKLPDSIGQLVSLAALIRHLQNLSNIYL